MGMLDWMKGDTRQEERYNELNEYKTPMIPESPDLPIEEIRLYLNDEGFPTLFCIVEFSGPVYGNAGSSGPPRFVKGIRVEDTPMDYGLGHYGQADILKEAFNPDLAREIVKVKRQLTQAKWALADEQRAHARTLEQLAEMNEEGDDE
jgi:hypothetical protein